jgi:uncharacterized protein (TIGR03435 family)
MVAAFIGLMLAVGSSLAASIVAKVTVTTALGLFAAWLARRNRAAVRHALLAAAFGVLLVLPVASVLAPPVHVAVSIAAGIRAAVPPLVETATADRPAIPVDAGVRAIPSTPRSSTLLLSDLLLAGWIVGMALCLLPVTIGLAQVRSLRRSGLPWRRGQSAVETIALDNGIHRRIEVLLHEALPGPMTCGVLHPAIVLPQDAENWSEEDLNRAIVHELEHVRRGDSVSRCIARVACAVYWFHPLVWIAWRKLALEAERACDDAVLRCSDATAYADQLVGLAKRLSLARRSPLLGMANRADLATRVGAVLDSRQRRGRAGTFAPALACVVAAVLVIAMSPLVMVGAPQGRLRPAFEVASVKPSAPVPPNGGVYFGPPRGGPGTPDPGLITWSYATLKGLLMAAYDVKNYAVSGPAWLNTERYDIVAKVPAGATREQVNRMWQRLLAERFGVVLHHESREFQVEELVVDKGGSKLKETAWDPASPLPSGPPQRDANGELESPGQVNTISPRENGASVHTIAKAQPISQLTATLSNALNRPVLDKTGLAGKYDYIIDFVIDQLPLPPPGQPGPGAPAVPGNATESGPDLAAAVQQQLGLRLMRSKAMLDVVVIDKAEKMPTAN